MAMDCACGVVVHTVAHNMDHILAVVLGLGSSQVSHKVGTVVAVVAVQSAFHIAQVGEAWSALAPLLLEAVRLAAPRYLCFLFLDYS